MKPLLLLLALSLFASMHAFAADQHLAVRATNLDSVEAADEFAREWVENYRRETPELDAPVLILHVGDRVPEQLRWVVAHLDRARVPYQLKLVKPAELDGELAAAKAAESEVLRFDESLASPATRDASVWSRAKLVGRRVFGLPGGMTFWVKVKSMAHQKLIEAGSAAFQSLQAGVSLGVSLYLVKKSGVDVNILPATGLLMAWVAANIYKIRPIVEVLTQGRTLKETSPGVYKVKVNRLFFYLSSAVRNFVLNGLIVGAAFGWDQPFTGTQLHTNLENTALSLVAGSWVEQWINSKQARTNPEGTPIPEAGKWSPRKTIVINTIWATAYYGIIRNLHLLNYGSAGKYAYYGLAAVGTAVTLYEERFWLLGKAKGLLRALGFVKPKYCETILLK